MVYAIMVTHEPGEHALGLQQRHPVVVREGDLAADRIVAGGEDRAGVEQGAEVEADTFEVAACSGMEVKALGSAK